MKNVIPIIEIIICTIVIAFVLWAINCGWPYLLLALCLIGLARCYQLFADWWIGRSGPTFNVSP